MLAMHRQIGRAVLPVIFGLLASACMGDEAVESSIKLDSVSTESVVLGQTLEFYGHGFLRENEGKTRLLLEGTFTDAFGQVQPSRLVVSPVFGGIEDGEGGRQILTWPRVGPFMNPFTNDNRHGRFEGRLWIENEYSDGSIETSESQQFALEVGPSVTIERFEPVDADCGMPVVRILPGVPYQLQVRTSGIKATRFLYEFSQINQNPGVTRIEHDLGRGNPSESDVVGLSELVAFNMVPDEAQSYVSGLRVFAYDDEGRSVETALPIGVHRPIEVIYDGRFEIAERYEPVPVSGCIPGSIDSRVSYEEQESESRQQSVSMTISNSWRQGRSSDVSQNTSEGISIGESRSQSFTNSQSESESLREGYGLSYNENESNSVGYASSDGESWSWNLSQGESEEDYESRMSSRYGEGSVSGSVGVSGEGSVAGFAKVTGSVETSVGVTAGMSSGDSSGTRRRTSTNRGYSMSGDSQERQSFGTVLSEGRSESISGDYALGRTQSTSEDNGMTVSEGRVWSLSEGRSMSETVSEGNSQAINNTWVNSETISTSKGFSGFIPMNRFGIFYRQTTRWVKRAEVRSYDLCGVATHMGDLQFNEWDWAPGLAIGDSCDTLPPPSNLPSAQCFIDPCGG